MPTANTPSRRVAADDRIGVAFETEYLRAEGVQAVSTSGQRPHDLFDFGGVLAPADAAYSDQWQCGEVNAMAFVPICATMIVHNIVSLEDLAVASQTASSSVRRAMVPRLVAPSSSVSSAMHRWADRVPMWGACRWRKPVVCRLGWGLPARMPRAGRQPLRS